MKGTTGIRFSRYAKHEMRCRFNLIKARREDIKAAMEDIFNTEMRVREQLIMSEETPKREIELAKEQKKYEKRIYALNRCFDEFQLLSPTTILYGSEEMGNYRECNYGDNTSFQNAIWIHQEALKELIQDEFVAFPSIKVIVNSYLEELNEYKKFLFISCKLAA